jgi:hypothetical protein
MVLLGPGVTQVAMANKIMAVYSKVDSLLVVVWGKLGVG